MIYTKTTKKALMLCFNAHKDQLDKSGLPYVFHPFHLAEQMDDELSTATALLHDVVEDTDYSLSDLENMGFQAEIILALSYLTHDSNTPYMEYVKKIKENPIAKKVKLADLRHNSDLSRMEEEMIDEWAIARNKKYEAAIKLLEEN